MLPKVGAQAGGLRSLAGAFRFAATRFPAAGFASSRFTSARTTAARTAAARPRAGRRRAGATAARTTAARSVVRAGTVGPQGIQSAGNAAHASSQMLQAGDGADGQQRRDERILDGRCAAATSTVIFWATHYSAPVVKSSWATSSSSKWLASADGLVGADEIKVIAWSSASRSSIALKSV